MENFTLRDLLTHIIRDIAKAVCERPGESPQQRTERVVTATHTVMAFQPADAIEAMLVGRCVMFHEMIVDTFRSAFEAGPDRAARNSIVAMDKAFGANLTRLERHRARAAAITQPVRVPVSVKATPDTPPPPYSYAGNRQARRHPDRHGQITTAATG